MQSRQFSLYNLSKKDRPADISFLQPKNTERKFYDVIHHNRRHSENIYFLSFDGERNSSSTSLAPAS
jgi:hypothetical protein